MLPFMNSRKKFNNKNMIAQKWIQIQKMDIDCSADFVTGYSLYFFPLNPSVPHPES